MKKIMNELRNSLLVLMGILVTTSCSNHDDMVFSSEKNLLKVETILMDSRNVVTGTSFKDGDQIGLFVKKEDGTVYSTISNCSNIKATYAHGTWNLATDVELNERETAYVYAYYPYNADIHVEGDSIDIDITPTTNDGQPDYMYGNAEASRKSPTAKIIFKHALARLTFAITKSETDKGIGNISQVALINAEAFSMLNTTSGVQYKTLGKQKYISVFGKMNMVTGQITPLTNPEAEIKFSSQCVINAEKAQYIDILVNPVVASTIRPNTFISNDVNVVLTIDGAAYSFPLKYPNWEAGEQYTYPITINRETEPIIKFNGFEAMDMGVLSDNDEIMYWAAYNVGADNIESYGNLYCWGDSTGEKTADSYIPDEYEAMFPNDISATEFDIARKKWGKGWRIPTKSEWERLIQNSTIEKSTIGSVKGYKIISKINGGIIFLPSTGYYSWNSTLMGGNWEHVYFEENAGYWSSTRDWQHAFVLALCDWKVDAEFWSAPLAGRYSIRPVISYDF